MPIHSTPVPNLVRRLDPQDQSAAYKIFHHRFLIHIAQMHLMSAEYVRQSGTVYSGNDAITENMAREKVLASYTIADLAELVHNGQDFHLHRADDSKTIYEILTRHLVDFREAMERNQNLIEIPLEDLIKFDQLASKIYPIARHYIHTAPTHNTLMNKLSEFQRLRGLSRISKAQQEAKRASQQNSAPVQHTSMADALIDLSRGRKDSW